MEASVQEQVEVLKPFEWPICDAKFELKTGVKNILKKYT